MCRAWEESKQTASEPANKYGARRAVSNLCSGARTNARLNKEKHIREPRAGARLGSCPIELGFDCSQSFSGAIRFGFRRCFILGSRLRSAKMEGTQLDYRLCYLDPRAIDVLGVGGHGQPATKNNFTPFRDGLEDPFCQPIPAVDIEPDSVLFAGVGRVLFHRNREFDQSIAGVFESLDVRILPDMPYDRNLIVHELHLRAFVRCQSHDTSEAAKRFSRTQGRASARRGSLVPWKSCVNVPTVQTTDGGVSRMKRERARAQAPSKNQRFFFLRAAASSAK